MLYTRRELGASRAGHGSGRRTGRPAACRVCREAGLEGCGRADWAERPI